MGLVTVATSLLHSPKQGIEGERAGMVCGINPIGGKAGWPVLRRVAVPKSIPPGAVKVVGAARNAVVVGGDIGIPYIGENAA